MPTTRNILDESLIVRTIRDVARSIERGSGSPGEGPSRERSWVIQQMVRLCRVLPEAAAGAWEHTRRLDEAGEIPEYQEAADVLLGLIDALLRLTEKVESDADASARAGFPVDAADSLADVKRELSALRVDILAAWPWADEEVPPPDPAAVEEALRDFRGGDAQTLEDFIRDLQGPHPEGD